MNPAAAPRSTAEQDALRGASLAFRRGPAAGATHDVSSISRPRSPLGAAGDGVRGHDVDSSVCRAGMAAALHRWNGGSPAQLQPASVLRLDPKSPSFIAATLAASRSVSPSPPATTTPRRRASFGAASSLGCADAVDSESIAPTGSLISMFERARGHLETTTTTKTTTPLGPEVAAQESSMPAKKSIPAPSPDLRKHHGRPPTPPRGVDELRSSSMPPRQPPTPPLRSSEKISAMPMPKPRPPQQPNASPRPSAGPSSTRLPLPTAELTPGTPGTPGLLPPARPSAEPVPKPLRLRLSSPPSVVSISTPELLSPKPVRLITPELAPPGQGSSSGASAHAESSPSPDPEKRRQSTGRRPPTPPKPRGGQRLFANKSGSRSRRRGHSDTPSSTSGVSSAAPLTEFGLPIVTPSPPQQPVRQLRQKNTPPPLPVRRGSVASAPTSPVRDTPRRRRPTSTSNNSNLTLDPLTSAIMASSLASSRLRPHDTGSSLPPPSLPSRQKSPRLLQTLRQPQSHSDDDPERIKIAHRHKLSSNKHAHHEGSRKRWRDQITQRERKRYEAVWASNRGFLVTDDKSVQSAQSGLQGVASECVANVVVREIWKRCRLPEDELVEVWDLVDRSRVGMLTRQEFIVGMWLIDQRLRGRKLPARVSDSVWNSANGVRISKPKAR
ncbi:Increased rDNA silencing protein [Metarhizium rileyi]|uniref:Increased rDNA silencing protein n=1 Tax=Metarhizium rileyi (strain RCEF 4871) TaxID=1649241 RepID=A0A5C6GBI3_METRR|nr:Increased rDNA silencing protein [Metarhizium rileyi]